MEVSTQLVQSVGGGRHTAAGRLAELRRMRQCMLNAQHYNLCWWRWMKVMFETHRCRDAPTRPPLSGPHTHQSGRWLSARIPGSRSTSSMSSPYTDFKAARSAASVVMSSMLESGFSCNRRRNWLYLCFECEGGGRGGGGCRGRGDTSRWHRQPMLTHRMVGRPALKP